MRSSLPATTRSWHPIPLQFSWVWMSLLVLLGCSSKLRKPSAGDSLKKTCSICIYWMPARRCSRMSSIRRLSRNTCDGSSERRYHRDNDHIMGC